MADPPSHPSIPRRRSSIAYDPARDTFTEIPTTIAEDAVIDEPSTSSPEPATRPEKMETSSTSDESKKRKHPITEDSERGDSKSDINRSPAEKRQRSDAQRNGTSTTEEPGRNNKSSYNTNRIPKATREEGEVRQRPDRVPSAFSRRSDLPYDSRRDQNGDSHRYRERRRERPERRSRSPEGRMHSAFQRRSPPRPARRDPNRSPSPIRRSPPREQIRPGGARGRGRNVLAEQQRLQAQREHGSTNNVDRGVQGVANQWYNQLPEYVKERGRDWRKHESQIKGLRVFNNWVKSCLIQKFSPQEKRVEQEEELGWGETAKEPEEMKPLLVLDIGCGKGGDLGKWEKAPQAVGLYCGLDPAETSIDQAKDRFRTMWRGRRPRFDAQFAAKDCFGEWIGDVPIVAEVGIDPAPGNMNRWARGGGFDIVSIMFAMHYSFESQEKVEMMLRNVAGSLKKGGRFIGVCPNSDVIAGHVREWYKKNPSKVPKAKENPTDTVGDAKPENKDSVPPPSSRVPVAARAASGVTPTEDGSLSTQESLDGAEAPAWGNSIYNVRFPPVPAVDATGQFRPPFSWKYTYWMAEAVDVPEFVVPWEAFRAIAENFGLEQRYRKGFLDIWDTETDPARVTGGDPNVARELKELGRRMGVIRDDRDRGRDRDDSAWAGGAGGDLIMSSDEREACAFYHGFCFVKV